MAAATLERLARLQRALQDELVRLELPLARAAAARNSLA
jgi:hypothetical protein